MYRCNDWQKVAKEKFVPSLQLARELGSVGQWNSEAGQREYCESPHFIQPLGQATVTIPQAKRYSDTFSAMTIQIRNRRRADHQVRKHVAIAK